MSTGKDADAEWFASLQRVAREALESDSVLELAGMDLAEAAEKRDVELYESGAAILDEECGT